MPHQETRQEINQAMTTTCCNEDNNCHRHVCAALDFVIFHLPTIYVIASWICVLVALFFPNRTVAIVLAIVFSSCFLLPLLCVAAYFMLETCCVDDHRYVTV